MSGTSTTLWFKALQCLDTSLCLLLSLFDKMNWFQFQVFFFWVGGGFQSVLSKSLHSRKICLFQLCQSCHVFLLSENLAVTTSHRPGHTTIGWWVLAIMAVECPWLKEVGLRSGWVIALSLTFVENNQSAISNNDQSTLTFDGRQIAHVQITIWWHANHYTIPRTILVFRTITPQKKLLPTIILGLPWTTPLREDVREVLLSPTQTNTVHVGRWVNLHWQIDVWEPEHVIASSQIRTMLPEIHQSKCKS